MKFVCTKSKRYLDLAIKPTKHKQTNNRPTFFELEYSPFEKKTGPGQIRIQEICLSRRVFVTSRISDLQILRNLTLL